MKIAGKLALALSLVLAIGFVAQAEDKKGDKEVKIEGTITCAKCGLKEADKCATVIKTKEKGKDVVYYFDKDSHKKYHSDTCTEAKDGTVTGVKGEKDGKKTVKVSKLEYKDK